MELTHKSVVRGYHVYKDVWQAVTGEILRCERERTNRHDPFAVAVIKDGITVGHVPRKISAVCSMYLRKSGAIMTCKVDGSRQYSYDLPQGGLEIPCYYIFSGRNGPDLDKVQQLLSKVPSVTLDSVEDNEEEFIEIDDEEDESNHAKKRRINDDSDKVWLKVNECILKIDDYNKLSGGLELVDNHIHAAQSLLKHQFPEINGFRHTMAPNHGNSVSLTDMYLQILHCHGNHWIVFSTIGCKPGDVYVYDSLYTTIDNDTEAIIQKTFGLKDIRISLPTVQRQVSMKDCGLFAVAFATFLAITKDHKLLCSHKFKQHTLRTHLITCFETGLMTQFI